MNDIQLHKGLQLVHIPKRFQEKFVDEVFDGYLMSVKDENVPMLTGDIIEFIDSECNFAGIMDSIMGEGYYENETYGMSTNEKQEFMEEQSDLIMFDDHYSYAEMEFYERFYSDCVKVLDYYQLCYAEFLPQLLREPTIIIENIPIKGVW